MRTKRYSVEQIVAKLREAEKLQAQGLTIPQAFKRLGISSSRDGWKLVRATSSRRGRGSPTAQRSSFPPGR
jgi:hypothetical protein